MTTDHPRRERPVFWLGAAAWVALNLLAGAAAGETRPQFRTQDRFHVVQPGENLVRIAQKYDVDLKDLCEINGIADPQAVEKGQSLRIPRRKQTRVGMYHVVEDGQSLPAIAEAYHFSARSLASLNRIRTDTRLRKGQLIWVPGATERQTVVRGAGDAAAPSRTADFQPPQRPGSRRETKATARAAEDWRMTRPHAPPRLLAGGSPSPAPRVASAPQRNGQYHIVGRGENLRRIGEKYGIYNWQWLAEVNHLSNPGALEVGRRVYIPSLAERPVLAAVEASAQSQRVAASVDPLGASPFALQREAVEPSTTEQPPVASETAPQVARMEGTDGRAEIPTAPAEAEDSETAPSMPVRMTAVPVEFGWPLSVRAVRTVPFGVPRGKGFHLGVDLAANENTPILAVADGVVELVGSERDSLGKSLGNYFFISHGLYKYKTCRTIYAHAAKVLVKPGERVKKGQMVARVGNTGRSHGAEGGYHLHLELWYGDDCVDPWPVLEPRRPQRDDTMVQAE